MGHSALSARRMMGILVEVVSFTFGEVPGRALKQKFEAKLI